MLIKGLLLGWVRPIKLSKQTLGHVIGLCKLLFLCLVLICLKLFLFSYRMSVCNSELPPAGNENCPPASSPLLLLNSPSQLKAGPERTAPSVLCDSSVFSPPSNKSILKPSAYENLLQFTPQHSHQKVIYIDLEQLHFMTLAK